MARIRIRKNQWKQIISAALAILLIAGAVFGAVKLFGNQSKTISPMIFKVGGLDEVTGKYIEDNTSIYTEQAFSCQGLRIVPKFESQVAYDVYYYDVNDKLLENKLNLSEVFEEDYPMADSCRIVIHPDDKGEKNFKVRFWEVLGYANDLKITVDRKQVDYVTTSNLYAEDESSSGTFATSDITTITQNANMKSSAIITVNEDFDQYQIYVRLTSVKQGNSLVAFAGEGGKAIRLTEKGAVEDGAAYTFEYDDMLVGHWYSVIVEVPKGATQLRVTAPADADIRIYGINEK